MFMDSQVAAIAQAGKFLSFKLDDKEYGVEILKVQEVVGLGGLLGLPDTPDFLLGCLMLRGRNVPIIGMRRRLSLPEVQETEKTCAIIAQLPYGGTVLTVGLMVDEVCEVVNLSEQVIQFPPSGGGGLDCLEFVNGVGALEDRNVVLLDTETLLNMEELRKVATLVE